MKNLKSKLRLSLCLLIVCFSTFAQTDSHDCEIIVTRADLEKCATYKRQNELLEKEIKFQAVQAVSMKDTLIARNETIINLQKEKKELESILDFWQKAAGISAIIAIILILLIIFGPKIAAKISALIFFSSLSFAQAPAYNPPFSLNGQKGVNQTIKIDSTANSFGITSTNDVHTISIPGKKPIQIWHTGRESSMNLTEKHPQTIFILRDSFLLNLPKTSKELFYDIFFMGVRGGISQSRFMPYDTTARLTFSDTINFYNSQNNITYYTKVFDHLSAWPFNLKNLSRFGLTAKRNKWYLTLADFDY